MKLKILIIILIMVLTLFSYHTKAARFSVSADINFDAPFQHDEHPGYSYTTTDYLGRTHRFELEPFDEATKAEEVVFNFDLLLRDNFPIMDSFGIGLGRGFLDNGKDYTIIDVGGEIELLNYNNLQISTQILFETIMYRFIFDEHTSDFYLRDGIIERGTKKRARKTGEGYKISNKINYKSFYIKFNYRKIKFGNFSVGGRVPPDNKNLDVDVDGSYLSFGFEYEF